jgi:5'-methylthioadenosine phosphorylase
MMAAGKFAVIGGSGLYQIEGLQNARELEVKTPFGKPSDKLILGKLSGAEVVFLARHGRGHRLLPGEINFRANIFALKKLGVERIISVSAVGSLRKEIAPGHLVVPDQFIDRTTQRPSTFFGGGIVAHVSLAEPFCPELSGQLLRAAKAASAFAHGGGVYLCMEGPQFSTRAESNLYRAWGADIIGMTNLQEAKLAREAEICFGTLAMATDYDCWNEEAGNVEIEQVLKILSSNVELAKKTIHNVIEAAPAARSCSCNNALKNAIITERRKIPKKLRADLRPIVGKYL